MKKNVFKLIKILNILFIFGYILYFIELKYNINSIYTVKYNLNSTYNKITDTIIYIPKINLKQKIVKAKDDFSNLDKNLVYYKNINIDDKIVILGHSGIGYGTFFNRLDEMTFNDILYLYNDDKEYKYRVQKVYKIDETKVDILKEEKNSKTLLLVTCDKKNKKKRLIIKFMLENTKNP